MQTYRKKKLEIIVEQPLLRRMEALVDRLGATGWTVLPVLAARGHHRRFSEDELLSALSEAMLVVVTRAEVAERILEQAETLLADRTGVIFVSDVEVLRDEMF